MRTLKQRLLLFFSSAELYLSVVITVVFGCFVINVSRYNCVKDSISASVVIILKFLSASLCICCRMVSSKFKSRSGPFKKYTSCLGLIYARSCSVIPTLNDCQQKYIISEDKTV